MGWEAEERKDPYREQLGKETSRGKVGWNIGKSKSLGKKGRRLDWEKKAMWEGEKIEK